MPLYLPTSVSIALGARTEMQNRKQVSIVVGNY